MLTQDDTRDCQDYLREWRRRVEAPTSQADLVALFENINRVYAEMGLKEPNIILCGAPLQQTIFPALVSLMVDGGQRASSVLAFKRWTGDTELITQGWNALWSEACDQIDWSQCNNSDSSLGALINEKLEDWLNKTAREGLFESIESQFGEVNHYELQPLVSARIIVLKERLQRALFPSPDEMGAHWRGLMNRVPQEWNGLFKASVQSRHPAFFRLQPTDNNWVGAWYWPWLATSDFLRQQRCSFNGTLNSSIDLWLSFAFNCTACLFFENFCFVYEKPLSLLFDDRGRLHAEDRPAVTFADKTGLFFWHGAEVEEEIVTKPDTITIKRIHRESNAEIRRILIERFGFEQFIRLSGAKLIQEDECGALYEKQLEGDEPIVVVKVLNSTPEPDGSDKHYWLRVPPEVRTAREAVAWTFGMEAQNYAPRVET
ncbi:MAG TPA: hypothetical protein V6C81_10130 [Planktothrix sp.]|jgi:hypothetical protein